MKNKREICAWSKCWLISNVSLSRWRRLWQEPRPYELEQRPALLRELDEVRLEQRLVAHVCIYTSRSRLSFIALDIAYFNLIYYIVYKVDR